MPWQRLLALFVALILIPRLFGCARSAEPGKPAAIESASAQAATLNTRKADTTDADTINEDRTETDTTWNCPPEVDGPVISLRPDTSRKYPEQADVVVIEDGEFAERSAVVIWRKDLNEDGKMDVGADILGLSGSWGEGLHVIYTSCSDNHYIRVWGPEHAFKLETGDPDTVAGNWMPIRAFSREGEEFIYIFSGDSYMRKR